MKVEDIVQGLEEFLGVEITQDDLLKLETIQISQETTINEESLPIIEALAKLDNIKTILVSPNTGIDTDSPENISGLKAVLDSGVKIDFIGDNGGGYLLFGLEYGIDDCTEHDMRENSFPLCKNFSDYLNIYINPNKFIDELDDEDVYGLLKK